jgi:hypothetical protein
MSEISADNRYTSVRKYAKPKPDVTAPTIEFVNYRNDQVVSGDAIDVQVRVTDDKTSPELIVVE